MKEACSLKHKLLELFAATERLIETHIGWIVLLFLLNYFTIVWQNLTMYQTTELPVLLLDGAFLLVGVGLYCLLLACIPWRRVRQALFGVTFVLSAALAGLEVFAITTYQTLVGAGIITAILQTNPREAGEFLQMYFGWRSVLSLGTFFALLVLGWGWFFRQRFALFSRRMRNVLFLVIFLAGVVSGTVLLQYYMNFILSGTLDIPPVRVGQAAYTATENIAAYEELSSQMQSHVTITENASDTPQVVFILGEATARGRLHLYGYPLENTPNFDELAKNGDIAVFRDIISPEGATVAALQKILTFADVESMAAGQEWYEANNLIDVMNAAGYQTHWLSNQESSGIWGNVSVLFANRATTHAFTRMRESHEEDASLDEELFPMIDDAMANGSGKDFYVVHLMGCHGLYYFRYPYIFTKYLKDDLAAPESSYSEDKRTEIAQYADAVYYNDFVVSSIFGKFADKDALVIYLPDHGEAVYDNDGYMSGHVQEHPNRYMLEVPFLVYASPSWRAKHTDKWQAIKAATERPYMTDDLIHTLLDVLDIRTPEYDPTKSVVNPAYKEKRPRIVQGRDYDRSMK